MKKLDSSEFIIILKKGEEEKYTLKLKQAMLDWIEKECGKCAYTEEELRDLLNYQELNKKQIGSLSELEKKYYERKTNEFYELLPYLEKGYIIQKGEVIIKGDDDIIYMYERLFQELQRTGDFIGYDIDIAF